MYVLLFIMVAEALSANAAPASKRVTRVINGELVLGRSIGYNSVRYFTLIGTMHGTKPFTIFVYQFPMEYGGLICGGALITPTIIQTACHCLSYDYDPSSETTIRPAKTKHNWEDIIRVYIGVNKEFGEGWSMVNISPLVSKKFVIHESCSYLPKGAAVVTYDYGWIVVDSNWDPTLKDTDRIDFAPLYTEQELENTWRKVNQQLSVCLKVGFGPHVKHQSIEHKRMRHGWSVVLPESTCAVYTRFRDGLDLGYIELNSWVCLVPFSKHFQPSAPGDSGSPVSCNNQYFAVVSSGVDTGFSNEDVDRSINYDDALHYAKFQNTKEARRAFILYIDDYAKPTPGLLSLQEDTTFPTASHHSDLAHHQHVLSSISPQRNPLSSFILAISLVQKLINNLR